MKNSRNYQDTLNAPADSSRDQNEPKSLAKSFFSIVLLVFVALTLGRVFTNMPWCDEGWFFNPPYSWLTKGHTGTTAMEATGFPWEGIERHMYWQPPLHMLIHTPWMAVFGLNLFSFRLCSLAAGIVALFMWRYLFTYIATPQRLANAALLLIAVDYSFTRTASDGRTDMLSSMFGLCATVAYLHFRERNFTAAVFLSQLLIVCSGLTHPMGAFPAYCIVGYTFFTKKDWNRLRWTHLPLALLPYGIGAAGWGAYILQEPETFKKIFLGSSVSGRTSGILRPLDSLYREFYLRYLVPNGWEGKTLALRIKTLIPFIYLASVPLALLLPGVRRMPHIRKALLFCLFTFLCMFLLDGQRNGTYLAHIFPWYALLLVSSFYWLWESRAVPRFLPALAYAGVLLLHLGGSLYIIYTNPYKNDYSAAIAKIRQVTPPGGHVVGTVELGFGLGFDNFLDDLTLGYNNRKKPDVVVVNDRYRTWFESFKKDKPAIHEFVTGKLANEYKLTYRRGSFDVYEATPVATRTQP